MYSFDVGTNWREGISPVEAAIEAAKLFATEYSQEPIYVPMSGGIDSECVALSFLLAEISIQPVIMKFANGFNDFDTDWAFSFCRKQKIKPMVLSLDLDTFYASGSHLEYAEKYSCRSPQLATHLWMLDQMQGNFVFPYNPIVPMRTISGNFLFSFPPDLHLCYDRYLDHHNRPGLGLFLLYTPNLIYSFMQLPLYGHFLFSPRRYFRFFSDDQHLIKYELYRAGGFEVQIRPRKATGFELYREHLNKVHSSAQFDYFDQNYRKPMEKIAGDPNLLVSGNIDLARLRKVFSELNP